MQRCTLEVAEWLTEMSAVTVEALSLRNPDCQRGHGPQLAHIVVAAQQDQEDHKGRKSDGLVAVQKAGAGEGYTVR